MFNIIYIITERRFIKNCGFNGARRRPRDLLTATHERFYTVTCARTTCSSMLIWASACATSAAPKVMNVMGMAFLIMDSLIQEMTLWKLLKLRKYLDWALFYTSLCLVSFPMDHRCWRRPNSGWSIMMNSSVLDSKAAFQTHLRSQVAVSYGIAGLRA